MRFISKKTFINAKGPIRLMKSFDGTDLAFEVFLRALISDIITASGSIQDLTYNSATGELSISSGNSIIIPEATSAVPGLMSASDKAKLDTLEVEDLLTSVSTTNALSANQGRVLNLEDIDTGSMLPDGTLVLTRKGGGLVSIPNVKATEITGQFVGSSTTIAGMPTVDALGDPVSNGDWAALTTDDGPNERGIYVWDGATWQFVMSINETFDTIYSADGTISTNRIVTLDNILRFNGNGSGSMSFLDLEGFVSVAVDTIIGDGTTNLFVDLSGFNLQFGGGTLKLNGNSGNLNQVVTSQGPGLPPIWKDTSSNLEISLAPPADTSKLWFNQNDELLYFNDGSNWVTAQLYETTFNDQGTTPNNTFFRVGNTVTNDLGIGYYLEFTAKVEGLAFNRNPNTAQLGNFWLYSNSVTGTDIASVVTTFTVNADGRGFLLVPAPLTLNSGSYISIRWNGAQTNNNIVSLKYRKIYI